MQTILQFAHIIRLFLEYCKQNCNIKDKLNKIITLLELNPGLYNIYGQFSKHAITSLIITMLLLFFVD